MTAALEVAGPIALTVFALAVLIAVAGLAGAVLPAPEKDGGP